MQTLTNREWLNVFGNMMGALNFSAIAVVLLNFLRCKDIGHRKLLWLNCMFSIVQALKGFSTVWDLAHHVHTMHSAMFRFGCSVVQSILVVYFLAVIADVLVTLRRSEHINRLEGERAIDTQQGGINLSFLSAQTKNASEALLMRRQAGRDGGETRDVNDHFSRNIRPSSGPLGYGHHSGGKQITPRW